MTETPVEKFATRLAHNGGEAIICKNYDIAVKFIAGLTKSEAPIAGRADANANFDENSLPDFDSNSSSGRNARTKTKVYLSKALDGGFAKKITTALCVGADFILLEAVSDDAEICVAPAAALLAEDGALVIDAARVAHEETLFGSISVLVADGGTKFYNNMAEFFGDAAAGKGVVRPDKTVIIAGPSKTADIEKQVVPGMHGPKKLVCLVIDNPPAIENRRFLSGRKNFRT
ncbi:MAG: hypothetical protein A2008_13990 [Candidatus Wallbacteria bacterium GWC2_49_35]|uniref:LUD domain-containing protein n=1 Tax=Candidatus Wallbacteria bacterium GWC2_49_35 TaxID=1817813 RepID=A0A1F7WRS2_9BACT|nr:MAG: hypothetical protein A2008_13990 [Candidatus Wallbacteria bacterium GWC2_49_35]